MSKERNTWIQIFTVGSPKEHHDGYTVYKIVRTTFPVSLPEQATTLTCWKRWSQIQALHKSFLSIHKNLYLHGDLPVPPKTSYFNRKDQSVIKSRAKFAQDLLEFAAANSVLGTSTALVSFFTDGDNGPVDAYKSFRSSNLLFDLDSSSLTSSSSASNCNRSLGSAQLAVTVSHDLSIDCTPTLTPTEVTRSPTTATSEAAVYSPTSSEGVTKPTTLGIAPTVITGAITSSSDSPTVSPSTTQVLTDKNSAVDTVHQSRGLEILKERTDPGSIFKADNLRGAVEQSPECEKVHLMSGCEFSSQMPDDTMSISDLSSDGSEETLPPFVVEAGMPTYITEAAELIASALSHEADDRLEESIAAYRSAIGKLLSHVQSDPDASRQSAVKKRIAQYIAKAELLVKREREEGSAKRDGLFKAAKKKGIPHLELFGHLTDLRSYRVKDIIHGKNILAAHKNTSQTVIFKILQKSSAVYKKSKTSLLPINISYMVELKKYFETDDAVFLMLEHCPAGKLWDVVKPLVEQQLRIKTQEDVTSHSIGQEQSQTASAGPNPPLSLDDQEKYPEVFSRDNQMHLGANQQQLRSTSPGGDANTHRPTTGRKVSILQPSPSFILERTQVANLTNELGDAEFPDLNYVHSQNTSLLVVDSDAIQHYSCEDEEEGDLVDTQPDLIIQSSQTILTSITKSLQQSREEGLEIINKIQDIEIQVRNHLDGNLPTTPISSDLSLLSEPLMPNQGCSTPLSAGPTDATDSSSRGLDSVDPESAVIVNSSDRPNIDCGQVKGAAEVVTSSVERVVDHVVPEPDEVTVTRNLTSDSSEQTDDTGGLEGEEDNGAVGSSNDNLLGFGQDNPSSQSVKTAPRSPIRVGSTNLPCPRRLGHTLLQGHVSFINADGYDLGQERRPRLLRKLSEVLPQCVDPDLGEATYLPDRLVRLWAAELAQVITSLHYRDIIIRDLNPHNVLLDSEGHVKLTYQCEWVSVEKDLSQFALEGKYVAPEVISIGDVTPVADWWSYGAILHLLYTGQGPASLLPSGLDSSIPLEFPATMDTDSIDFLTRLLQIHPHDRLGAGSSGSQDIREHPYFGDFNWQKMSFNE